MVDITKKTNRLIPPTMRSQNFRLWAGGGDFSGGDVLLVEDSLGHPASHVDIEVSGADLQVMFNVYHTQFPRRGHDLWYPGTYHLPNVASGVQIEDTTGAVVQVEDGTTYNLSNEFPVRDIKILTSGISPLAYVDIQVS